MIDRLEVNSKKEALAMLEEITGKVTFAKLILAIREADRIDAFDFAKKLGIPRSLLCIIEDGMVGVNESYASHFAKVLGYPQEQFIRLARADWSNEEEWNQASISHPYKPQLEDRNHEKT